MENEEKEVAARFTRWVESTGLTKVDLAAKLSYPRNSLYATMNTGKISNQLYNSILRHFPDTDMNWLLKGSYSEKGSSGLASEPIVPYSRQEKIKHASAFLEKDLLKSQVRTADALERLASLFERYLELQTNAK